jgi:hypothetical protein
MRSVPVAEIAVTSGLVHVTPQVSSPEGFEYIYRSATGVRWLPAERCFAPAQRGALTHGAWFREIAAAAAGEYGVNLQITPATRWREVPDEVRAEIESYGSQPAV